MKKTLVICLILSFLLWMPMSCKKDPTPSDSGPQPYTLTIPKGFPPMPIPTSNPLTVEGISLGRKLFYDPILSGDNTQSCGSCHRQAYAFVDSSLRYSIGIDKLPGNRNAMPLFNLGWIPNGLFWDGGATDMESQVIGPITNPVEMHEELSNAISELRAHPVYPGLFKAAFGSDSITTVMMMKAIAQFERTMVSGNSKYDQWKNGNYTMSASEERGMQVYSDPNKGDCIHCHVLGSLFTDFEFRNDGLDSVYQDPGRERITRNPDDHGKFRTPSLRNIALTAPYMHDGRFATLQQVIEHYNNGIIKNNYTDPSLIHLQPNRLNQQEKEDLELFLRLLTDEDFTKNPAFSKP